MKKEKTIQTPPISQESLYFTFARSTPAMMWLADQHCDGIFFNDSWLKFRGRTLEEEIGSGWLQGVHPDDKDRLLALSNPAALAHRPFEAEHRLLRNDGVYRWVFNSGAPFFKPDGTCAGYCGSCIDISERKALEEKLAMFAHTFQESRNPIVITDASKRTAVLYVNPAFEKITGYASFEVIGKNLRFLHDGDDEQPDLDLIRDAIQNGKECLATIRNYRRDGTMYWNELSISPIRNEYGELTHFVGIQTDVTQRKSQDSMLRRNSALLEAIYNESPDAIFLVDVQTNRIIDCNARAEALFERPKRDLIGIYGGTLQVRDFTAEERAVVHHALLKHNSWSGEIEYLNPTGKRFWGYLSIKSFLIGKHLMLLVRVTDISQKKQSQLEKAKLESQVLQLQKMEALGTLSAGIAHDFNNLLTIVQMANSFLMLKMQDTALGKYPKTINDAVDRGKHLVAQLGMFARSDKSEFSVVHVGMVLAQVKSMLAVSFPKSIRIHLNLEAARDTILGNASNLSQLFLNLGINAKDAMPEGGDLHFTLSSISQSDLPKKFNGSDAPSFLVIRIADTGVGIPDKVKERIFEPFFTTKGVGKGTGLGLAIVHGIVLSHNGFIDVYSEIGKGTVFTIYFPLCDANQDPRKPKAHIQFPKSTKQELILYIDDEPSIIETVSETLKEFGFRTLTASNGKEGLALYEEYYAANPNDIALVITDLGMPKLSGDAVVKKILERNPRQKIFVASGYLDEPRKEALIKLGALAYLQKPFEIPELMRAILGALDDGNFSSET